MLLDPDQVFDRDTFVALRRLRRDRKLTLCAVVRPWGFAADDTGEELAHFIGCLDLDRNRLLCGGPVAEDERDAALLDMIARAMLEPDEPARPALPRRIIVEESATARAIEEPMRRLGVDVVVARVPALDGLIEALRTVRARIPTWYRDPSAGLPLYQAAAALWTAAPWERLADVAASAVIELGEPVGRSLYSMAVETDDEVAGVMFAFSPADFERMAQPLDVAEDEPIGPALLAPDLLRNFDMLMVLYVEPEDADKDESEHVAAMRWPVGSGSAYPRFVRTQPGEQPRDIDDDEAHLLTLAMDALARFCLAERARLARGELPLSADVRVRDGDEVVAVRVRTPAEVG